MKVCCRKTVSENWFASDTEFVSENWFVGDTWFVSENWFASDAHSYTQFSPTTDV